MHFEINRYYYKLMNKLWKQCTLHNLPNNSECDKYKYFIQKSHKMSFNSLKKSHDSRILLKFCCDKLVIAIKQSTEVQITHIFVFMCNLLIFMNQITRSFGLNCSFIIIFRAL